MKLWVLSCVAAMTVACGHKGGGSGDGTIDATGTGIDASFDAPSSPGGMCISTGPQCSNCKDDDGDGRIDGFDPQCTGASDNDEATFATGIPGDNKDAVNQDCFFDGNSGAGNDGCNIHVCCLLGAMTVAECKIGANQYNPNDCPPPIGTKPLSQQCIDVCGKLAPPGCDCFGCCTICDPTSTTNQCSDIIINPTTSPECGPTTINDPTKCQRCTKVPSCGNSTCGDASCILCPGQDPSDLPASCNMTACPTGEATCTPDTPCADGTYCSAGCCIGIIL
jgi:hypothetical protein